MKTAFVTGGSGFVGRELIPTLVRAGWTVRALARSDSAAAEVSQAGAQVVRGDLDDAAVLAAGMAGAEVVFHLAAKVEDSGDPADFQRINVVGTEHVLAAAKTAKVPRLVHCSTEAVLVGGRPLINADESFPRPAKPGGLYPLTKGLAEDRVRAASDSTLATMIVRPRFVWGRGDTTVMPRMIEAVRAGKWKWISGGHYKTSTCHVANLVTGMLAAAERGRGGETYFLTDGAAVEFKDFITRLLASQGVTPKAGNVPRWLAHLVTGIGERFSKRPVVTRTALRLMGEEVTVSDAKARRELGYAPTVTVDAGLAELAAGHAGATGS